MDGGQSSFRLQVFRVQESLWEFDTVTGLSLPLVQVDRKFVFSLSLPFLFCPLTDLSSPPLPRCIPIVGSQYSQHASLALFIYQLSLRPRYNSQMTLLRECGRYLCVCTFTHSCRHACPPTCTCVYLLFPSFYVFYSM